MMPLLGKDRTPDIQHVKSCPSRSPDALRLQLIVQRKAMGAAAGWAAASVLASAWQWGRGPGCRRRIGCWCSTGAWAGAWGWRWVGVAVGVVVAAGSALIEKRPGHSPTEGNLTLASLEQVEVPASHTRYV